jgi:hypothetical protein
MKEALPAVTSDPAQVVRNIHRYNEEVSKVSTKNYDEEAKSYDTARACVGA